MLANDSEVGIMQISSGFWEVIDNWESNSLWITLLILVVLINTCLAICNNQLLKLKEMGNELLVVI